MPSQDQRSPSTQDPPSYDTLSIAPPSISAGGKKSLKEKWKDAKAEDDQRRAQRYTTVSAAEADRITGLDKHREKEEKKMKEGGRKGIGKFLATSWAL